MYAQTSIFSAQTSIFSYNKIIRINMQSHLVHLHLLFHSLDEMGYLLTYISCSVIYYYCIILVCACIHLLSYSQITNAIMVASIHNINFLVMIKNYFKTNRPPWCKYWRRIIKWNLHFLWQQFNKIFIMCLYNNKFHYNGENLSKYKVV